MFCCVVTSVVILHEKLTVLAGVGTALTMAGLFLSEYKLEKIICCEKSIWL